MKLNDIFEKWDKKRGLSSFRINVKTSNANADSLDEYSKEIDILVRKRAGLRVTQDMLAEALECSRDTVKNYEIGKTKGNWFYIYSVKYILEQYEWHLRQLDIYRTMTAVPRSNILQ